MSNSTNDETTEKPSSEAYVRGLREMADFIEAHPELPTPHYGSATSFFWSDLAGFTLALNAMGSFKKQYDEHEVRITREFSGGVQMYASVKREALGCRKIVQWDCPDKSLMRSLGLEEAVSE